MHGSGRLWMGLVGAFFLAWGGWELGELVGWLPEARFPWPLFIVLLGGVFLAGAVTGRWGCWSEEGRGEPPRPPQSP